MNLAKDIHITPSLSHYQKTKIVSCPQMASVRIWRWAQLKQINMFYSATSLVRPKLEELIPEKNSLEKIPKPLKRWMGRSQLLPEIVENVLRSLFWAAGSKQPSPCLQPPKVGGLLRHLLLLLKAPLTSLHFWSQIYMDFSQLWFRFLSSLAPSPTLHPAPSPPSSSPWWPCQPPSSPPGRSAHTHTNTHTHTIIFSSIKKMFIENLNQNCEKSM